jgi:hypothetical protein
MALRLPGTNLARLRIVRARSGVLCALLGALSVLRGARAAVPLAEDSVVIRRDWSLASFQETARFSPAGCSKRAVVPPMARCRGRRPHRGDALLRQGPSRRLFPGCAGRPARGAGLHTVRHAGTPAVADSRQYSFLSFFHGTCRACRAPRAAAALLALQQCKRAAGAAELCAGSIAVQWTPAIDVLPQLSVCSAVVRVGRCITRGVRRLPVPPMSSHAFAGQRTPAHSVPSELIAAGTVPTWMLRLSSHCRGA